MIVPGKHHVASTWHPYRGRGARNQLDGRPYVNPHVNGRHRSWSWMKDVLKGSQHPVQRDNRWREALQARCLRAGSSREREMGKKLEWRER